MDWVRVGVVFGRLRYGDRRRQTMQSTKSKKGSLFVHVTSNVIITHRCSA